MKILFCGGAVRDMLMGRTPKDIDYVVVGATPEQMLAEGYVQVGADFPVFLKDDCEYALARTERKNGNGYQGFETHFDVSVTLEEDLYRRDITLNAMAMDEDGNIIDPYNGQEDLKNKIIRHVSPAFAEDPLRVLRVARFAARYDDFTIAPETLELMKQIVNSGELSYLSVERIFVEFEKAFSEKNCIKFITTLMSVGALQKLHPYFSRLNILSNYNFIELAENLNKISDVREKIALFLFYSFLTQEQVFELCSDLRFPNDIKQTYCDFKIFFELFDLYPVKVFDELKVEHDVYRFNKVLIMFNKIYFKNKKNAKRALKMIKDYRSINFNSLSPEIAKTLKGKQISEAITNKRIEVIKTKYF